MAEVTKIQWCDHTFNPWMGCTKVAAECAHCYAEEQMDKRWGKVEWGPRGQRIKTSQSNWHQPIRWNDEAAAAGVRRRVFCASLADVFEDRPELHLWRAHLFAIIDTTPHLDWLLLTKRPENIRRMWVLEANKQRKNVWLGTSAGTEETAKKAIPHLLECRNLSPVLFLSCEPLLGKGVLQWREYGDEEDVIVAPLVGVRQVWRHDRAFNIPERNEQCQRVDWVIVGGESGPSARSCNVAWIRGIVQYCKSAAVPVFVKQLGAKPVQYGSCDCGRIEHGRCHVECPSVKPQPLKLKDSKGGDPAEWPEDLRVREFPKVSVPA